MTGEPVVLRPGGLDASLMTMRQADLTVSCSYHAALTSSLLGVPAALVAENPYYAQKAAGLNADFALPGAYVLDPGQDPGTLAAGLADSLTPGRHPAVLHAIRLGALRSVARRREAEVLILGHLARALTAALTAGRAPEPARAAELMERLAVLRIDHEELERGAARSARAGRRAGGRARAAAVRRGAGGGAGHGDRPPGGGAARAARGARTGRDRVRHQPRVAVLAFHGALPEHPLAPRGSLAASSIPVAPSLTRRSTRLPIVLVRGSGEPRSPVAASHQ